MMNNQMVNTIGRLFANGLLLAVSVLLVACEKDSDKDDDGGYYITKEPSLCYKMTVKQ